jgi:hypothetical protein
MAIDADVADLECVHGSLRTTIGRMASIASEKTCLEENGIALT